MTEISYVNYPRLFKVGDMFFRHKTDAKRFRDHGKGLVVMRGPDHWRGESFNVSTQTASSKKREW